jgi:hypothetical protein
MNDTITYKTCSKCGVDKPLTKEYFIKDKSSFKKICKQCQNEHERVRYEIRKKTFTPNVICSICEQEFYKKPSDIEQYNFCGRTCFYEHKKQIKYPERRTGKNTECKTCKKEIYRIPSQLKENNFCSMECLYDYQKGRENIKLKNGSYIHCDECNKQFYRTPSALGENNFCSKECHDNSRKKRNLIECNECHKEYEIRLSRKIYNKNFCGKECEMSFRIKQNGKNDTINSNGDITRQCIICNSKKRLNVKFFNKHNACKEGFRPECKQCINDIKKERYNNDYLYKMSVKLRCLVYDAFSSKGISKIKKTEEILQCSIIEFIEYFNTLFKEGMDWNNHGEWHIDHRIPVSSAKTLEELIKLNHYANLQPLWADDNMRKSDTISDEWNNTMSIDELINTVINA